MNRSIRARAGIILTAAAFATANLPGCTIEEDDRDKGLSIGGTVTYAGEPVKLGTIHFLPVDQGRLPATGSIAGGEIQGVFTRTPGDGIKPGKYKVAITAFDEAFLQSTSKRNPGGPDPAEVARAANALKKAIPVRYSNPRESGLTAEFSPGQRTVRLDLVD